MSNNLFWFVSSELKINCDKCVCNSGDSLHDRFSEKICPGITGS